MYTFHVNTKVFEMEPFVIWPPLFLRGTQPYAQMNSHFTMIYDFSGKPSQQSNELVVVIISHLLIAPLLAHDFS